MKKPIVVGYDGSEVAEAAVMWALDAGKDRGIPVHLVTAWTLPISEVGIGAGAAFDHDLVEALREDATQVLQKGLDLAASTAPDVEVHGEVVPGAAAGVLVNKSEGAAITVTGSHGRGALAGLFLGSVSRQVATHSQSPTVVVRPQDSTGASGIVVGVDGSPSSVHALGFAFEEASRRGVALRILHTWEIPPIGAITGIPTFGSADMLDSLAEAEHRITAEEIAGYSEQYPDVQTTHEVLRGSPVKALKEASETAAMVVVGSRGLGGFRGLMLGSVSHAIVHQAKCSVAVVR